MGSGRKMKAQLDPFHEGPMGISQACPYLNRVSIRIEVFKIKIIYMFVCVCMDLYYICYVSKHVRMHI